MAKKRKGNEDDDNENDTEEAVCHRSEEEVISVLIEAKEMNLKLERLLDDETSNKRRASKRERQLFEEVTDNCRVIAAKYGIMEALRFDKPTFVKV